MTKESYHHGGLRRAILEAAVKGLESSHGQIPSFRELARTVGVTSGAPFHHFKNREELLSAIAAEGFELLLSDLREAIETRQAAAEQISELARRYIRFGRVHRAYYRIMFGPECATIMSSVELPAAACLQVLVDTIVRLRADPLSAHDTALAIWAQLHGVVDLGVGGPLEQKLTEDALESLAVQAALTLAMPSA